MNTLNSESATPYVAMPADQSDEDVIDLALRLIDAKLRTPGQVLTNPNMVKQFLRLQLARREFEVFLVLFLDIKNRMIDSRVMSTGTIAEARVYPREVARAAIELNASSVILAHNHPSGDTTPSEGDKSLTNHLKRALELLDIRVLDHVIVAGSEALSMAEQGLM